MEEDGRKRVNNVKTVSFHGTYGLGIYKPAEASPVDGPDQV